MSNLPFVSYAQNAEDVVLWRALGHVKQGRYVDVGANHPHIHSISQSFYERGWHGVTIEPMRDLAALHRHERPKDILVQAVASDTDNETVISGFRPGTGLSSLVAEVGEHSRQKGFSVRTSKSRRTGLRASWTIIATTSPRSTS